MQIGVIADTHSKIRPEALEVLDALEAIAPVVVILGNDSFNPPRLQLREIGDVLFCGAGKSGIIFLGS